MEKVTIYTTNYCPFCVRAKDLLSRRGIAFREIDVTRDPETRRKVEETTGWMTVPMIFIGEEFIGGCDDLDALARTGKLDEKLAQLN